MLKFETPICLASPRDLASASAPMNSATGTAPPGGQIWPLPAYLLTQLILGLSMLIASTTIVPRHDFRVRRY
jgi:hypothetical protein